jgi:hypothetical protein
MGDRHEWLVTGEIISKSLCSGNTALTERLMEAALKPLTFLNNSELYVKAVHSPIMSTLDFVAEKLPGNL